MLGGVNDEFQFLGNVDGLLREIVYETVQSSSSGGGGGGGASSEDVTTLKAQMGTGTFVGPGGDSDVATILGLSSAQGLRSNVSTLQGLMTAQATTNSSLSGRITTNENKLGARVRTDDNSADSDVATVLGISQNAGLRFRLRVNELAINGLENNENVRNDTDTASQPLRDVVGVRVTDGLRNEVQTLRNQVNGLIQYTNLLALSIIPALHRASTKHIVNVAHVIKPANANCNFNHLQLTTVSTVIQSWSGNVVDGDYIEVPVQVRSFTISLNLNIQFTESGNTASYFCCDLVNVDGSGNIIGQGFRVENCMSYKGQDRDVIKFHVVNPQGVNDSRRWAVQYVAESSVSEFRYGRLVLEGCHD